MVELVESKRPAKDNLWRCLCTCYNDIVVRQERLLRKGVQSCGCLTRERMGYLPQAVVGGRDGKKKRKKIFLSRTTDPEGYRYVYLPGHPNAACSGQVREHTFVMSLMLGRPLIPDEQAHHKNGIRSDNNPGNLELKFKAHGAGQRVEDLVDYVATYHRALLRDRLGQST